MSILSGVLSILYFCIRYLKSISVVSMAALTNITLILTICLMFQYVSPVFSAQPEEGGNKQLSTIIDDILAEPAFQQPRIVITGSVLSYDLSVTRISGFTVYDQRVHVLDLILRNAELRRDLIRLPAEPGQWDKDAEDLEVLNRHLMTAVEKEPSNNGESQLSELELQVENQLKRITEKLATYAESKGLTAVRARAVPQPFRVSVVIDPPEGRIFIMHFLDYKIAQHFGQPLDEKWDEIGPGINLLRGRYRFRAVWPAKIAEMVESNFSIDSEKELIFRPGK